MGGAACQGLDVALLSRYAYRMKLRIKTIVVREVRYLYARCGVRYWEDTKVNGEVDADGTRIPCRDGRYWAPQIDLETGAIVDWPQGTTARIHYKVCDDGVYRLCDSNRELVRQIDGYVPRIMCPGEEPDGDCVVMAIDEDGRIDGFRITLDEFERFD